MITPFFAESGIRSWSDAAKSDRTRFGRFHRGLLNRGVYWPPSQFEAGFVSLAHDERALAKTRAAVTEAMRDL
jgi:glutamate-1-semialdehyde 2,1-aminomutase